MEGTEQTSKPRSFLDLFGDLPEPTLWERMCDVDWFNAAATCALFSAAFLAVSAGILVLRIAFVGIA